MDNADDKPTHPLCFIVLAIGLVVWCVLVAKAGNAFAAALVGAL